MDDRRKRERDIAILGYFYRHKVSRYFSKPWHARTSRYTHKSH